MDPDKVDIFLGISEQQAAAYVDTDDTATDTLGPRAGEYTVKMDDIQTKLKWSKNEGHKSKLMITITM